MTRRPRRWAVAFAVGLGFALAGCAGGVRPVPTTVASAPAPPAKVTPPATASALGATAVAFPDFATADFAHAFAAFKRSCPVLIKRADASGLTQPGDWNAACAAVNDRDPRTYIERYFTAVRVGDGRGLDTGYYEPLLEGSRTAGPGYAVALYRRPPDLVELDLGEFSDALKGRKLRGRVAGKTFVPYYDRAAIEDGALTGRGLELAWAADPYAAFFLEIQGSGRLVLPGGEQLRIGYDGQNGRDYTAIGKLLRDRGALAPGQATMTGIIAWMRAHPAEGRALMRENRSKIFFRILTGDPTLGPPGALGIGLEPRFSVAADPAFVPLGAMLWLDTRVPGVAAPMRQLMVAQDTGGAIKGPNRIDVFWGADNGAATIAGGMSATGMVTLLLPRAAAERLVHGAPPAP
ncbi:MAG: murein transglycosylase A [Janthinobacterium lividum]